MNKDHRRTKPTTSFTLEPRQIEFLDTTALSVKANRSWVLGRIIDLFMRAPTNLIASDVVITNDEQAAD